MSAAGSNIHYGKVGISERVFQVVPWVCCSCAVLTVVIRVAVRMWAYRKLELDDCLLMFASACLITGLAYIGVNPQALVLARYLVEWAPGSVLDLSPSDILAAVRHANMDAWIIGSLFWTTLYVAKSAYLCVLRKLVLRTKWLHRFWYLVVAIVCVSYVVAVTTSVAMCPYLDVRAMSCGTGAGMALINRITLTVVVSDIVTDLMIVSIPIAIITKVKLRLSQKLGLALFLCLSIVLVAIAAVRVSRIRVMGAYGELVLNAIWGTFWFAVEGSLAVCLVSLAAFRSFFITHQRRHEEEEQRKKAWVQSIAERLKLKDRNTTMDSGNKLPSIPSATLTGLLSLFRGSSSQTSASETSRTLDGHSVRDRVDESEIKVEKTFQIHTTEIGTERDQYRQPTFDSSLQTQSVPSAMIYNGFGASRTAHGKDRS